MKDRMIKIADFLDSIGRESDADFLDSFIIHNVDESGDDSQEEIIIPEDEMEMLQEVFESLKRSLETK